jgi:hypothetical protein
VNPTSKSVSQAFPVHGMTDSHPLIQITMAKKTIKQKTKALLDVPNQTVARVATPLPIIA